jgi:hypothetical protein
LEDNAFGTSSRLAHFFSFLLVHIVNVATAELY